MLTPHYIATATFAGFVSYAIREYSTKCLDMQYYGGAFGGALKYWIKGNNPILGAINNLGYEVCNFHKVDPYNCKIMLETNEEIIKNWFGMPTIINDPFMSGLIISLILTISSDVVYSSLDKYVKTAFNFTADNNVTNSTVVSNSMVENNVCLVGEDPVWHCFDYAYLVCGIS